MEKRARVGVVFFAFLGVLVFDRKERKLKMQAETKVFQILFPRTFRVGNNAVLKRTRIAGIYIFFLSLHTSSTNVEITLPRYSRSEIFINRFLD